MNTASIFFEMKIEATVSCIDWIYQFFFESINLEMLTVNQLLVCMASPSRHLSNANTEGILKEEFSCSEDSNSDPDDEKITELSLVLQSVLFWIPEFKSPTKIPAAPGSGFGFKSLHTDTIHVLSCID
jgi:hypothetical protein